MAIALKNARMNTVPGMLSDDQLLLRSFVFRREATHGVKNARERAQAYEAEVRRRFTADAPTERGTLEQAPTKRRVGWRLW